MKMASVQKILKLIIFLSVHYVISFIVLRVVIGIADYVFVARPFHWWIPACSTVSFALFYLLVGKSHVATLAIASVTCIVVEFYLGIIGLDIGSQFERNPPLERPLDPLSGLYVCTAIFPLALGVALSLWKWIMCIINTEDATANSDEQ